MGLEWRVRPDDDRECGAVFIFNLSLPKSQEESAEIVLEFTVEVRKNQ